MKNARVLVYVSLLISLEIILTRFMAFQTDVIRIGLGFLPVALICIMFGPAVGGVAAAAADVLGMFIAPRGAYFPGFTLSALVTGVLYGLFLYGKPKTVPRIALAVTAVILCVDLGLNVLWISMITGKAVTVFISQRLIKSAIMLPLRTGMIYATWKSVAWILDKRLLKQT